MTVHVTEMTMTELAKRLFPESEPPDDHEKINIGVTWHATPAAVKEAGKYNFMGKVQVMPSSATIRVEFDDGVEEPDAQSPEQAS